MGDEIITGIGLITFGALLFQVGRHLKNQAERILEQSIPNDDNRDALAVGPRYWVAYLNVGALAFVAIGISTIIIGAWNHWR